MCETRVSRNYKEALRSLIQSCEESGGSITRIEIDDKVNIGGDILAVQRTWPVGKPLVGYLGDGIWEVRSGLKDRIARVLFMIDGEEMILLHGFIKKNQRTPKPDLDLARRRKRQYES